MNVKQPMASNKQAIRERKWGGILGRFVRASAPVRIVSVLVLLLLPILACGYINPVYQANNEVRLAVYEYERETRGKVDDLVIDFQRNEPRIVFAGQNENGGRTVWLYRLGAREFFALRPPEKTYLYIQQVTYNDDYTTATVTSFRGDGLGYQGRQLTLEKDNEQWLVIQDLEAQETELQ
jgi:hypothetical protein